MNWAEYLDSAEETIEDASLTIDEKLVKKVMVRDKQKVTKWVTDKVGWRVEYDKNHMPREVKISATEKKNRDIAQRKAKLKRKNRGKKQREQSFDVRERKGIDYDKENPALVTAREEGKKVPSDIKGALRQKLENMKDSLASKLKVKLPEIPRLPR